MEHSKSNNIRALPKGFVSPISLAGCGAGDRVLLALSGGPDSSALLDMLISAGVSVECAHLDHMIRGEAARRDAEFCRSLGVRYGVPVHVGQADVPASARLHGEGLEEAARRERYAFLSRVMRERGIRVLVTAHNADDNLETLLLRLVRGSGARGMCGIPPARTFDGDLVVVRPILGVTKAEILDYCAARGIGFVKDETNDDIEYSRNRLRALVLPELRRINPAAAEAAARLAASLREDCDHLDALAEDFVARRCSGGRAPAAELYGLPAPVSHRALARLYLSAGGTMAEEKHIRLMLDACGRGCGAVDLPGGVRAAVKDGYISFFRVGDAAAEQLPEEMLRLREGENALPGGCTVIIGQISREKYENINIIYKVSTKIRLNADKIKGVLYARRRLPGDRILQNGMHKSVKKLFCDKGIPPALRGRLPVICDDGGILFIPFIGARDGAAAGRDDPVLLAAVALPGDFSESFSEE